MITRIEMVGLMGATGYTKPPKASATWDQTQHNHTDHLNEIDESKRYWNPQKAVFFPWKIIRASFRKDGYSTNPVEEMAVWCRDKRFSLVVVAQCKCYDEHGNAEEKVGFLFRKREHAMRFKLNWLV